MELEVHSCNLANTQSFVSFLAGFLVNHYQEKLKHKKDEIPQGNYFRSIENLSRALAGFKEFESSLGIEEIAAAKDMLLLIPSVYALASEVKDKTGLESVRFASYDVMDEKVFLRLKRSLEYEPFTVNYKMEFPVELILSW